VAIFTRPEMCSCYTTRKQNFKNQHKIETAYVVNMTKLSSYSSRRRENAKLHTLLDYAHSM